MNKFILLITLIAPLCFGQTNFLDTLLAGVDSIARPTIHSKFDEVYIHAKDVGNAVTDTLVCEIYNFNTEAWDTVGVKNLKTGDYEQIMVPGNSKTGVYIPYVFNFDWTNIRIRKTNIYTASISSYITLQGVKK